MKIWYTYILILSPARLLSFKPLRHAPRSLNCYHNRFQSRFLMSSIIDVQEPPAKKAKKSKEPKEPKEVKEPKPKKEVNPDEIILREATPSPHVRSSNSNYLSIACWNVAGLRAVVKNNLPALQNFVRMADCDIICLQEHKLQNSHVTDHIDLLEGYKSFWVCSQTKLGYSGVAVFIRTATVAIAEDLIIKRSHLAPSAAQSTITKAPQKQKMNSFFTSSTPSTSTASGHADVSKRTSHRSTVRSITYDISDDARFHGDGRCITIELDDLYVVNCYVPNAGQGLKNIEYRVGEWDPALREYLATLRSTKSVILAGDLNVAHTDLDVYNPEAKHLVKQPGCTQRERESFALLLQSGFVDAFRHFFPTQKGCYSFWSGMNVVARGENKGLRLDYFLCSQDMMADSASASSATRSRAVDCQVLHSATVGISDHCPVVLTVELAEDGR